MSGPTVHVRIGRLVVDAPMRSEAAHWDAAIARALQAQMSHASQRVPQPHVPQAIARQITQRLPLATRGGSHAGR
jgi:hypothetical protein